MRRGAAANQVHRACLADRVGEALGIVRAFGGQPAEHHGLLVDLLGHVVREAFEAIDLFLPRDVPHAGVRHALTALYVIDRDLLGIDQRGLAVFEERQATGVLEQG